MKHKNPSLVNILVSLAAQRHESLDISRKSGTITGVFPDIQSFKENFPSRRNG